MRGFDLFFIPKLFGNSTSWQDIRGFRGTKTVPRIGMIPTILFEIVII
jgi:hypothetical protein